MVDHIDIRNLIEQWDGIIGEDVLGPEGIEGTIDYWYPLAIETVAAAIGGPAHDQADAVCATLASMDLLAPGEWCSLGAGERQLVEGVLERHGLGHRTSQRVIRSLEAMASQWCDRVAGEIRRTVRTAVHDMLVDELGPKLVPESIQSDLGGSTEGLVASWGGSVFGVHTRWSDAAGEFVDKFGIRFADLYAISDELDRSCARTDLVLTIFMDTMCRTCDPIQHPVCVAAAEAIDVHVECPLVPELSR